MTDANILASRAINRAMNLKEFEVLRDESDMILHGVFRYSVRHRPGEPFRIVVPAIDRAEAEQFADEWIAEMRAAE
jgi:hypothetical protein